MPNVLNGSTQKRIYIWILLSHVLVIYHVSSGELTLKKHDGYPMLYFNADDVAGMRRKAATTHAKIADIIKVAGKSLVKNPDLFLPPESAEKFSSRWNEVYGNNLCGFSIYCLLYPDDKEALDLLKIYMDRMASYPDWYVASSRNIDEVPVSHSLTGFVTAYDFLHQWLEPERRVRYYEKIKSETNELNKVLMKKHVGWTRQYIHNHAASNVVALLLGALVMSVREPEVAEPIIELAKTHLDIAMELLRHVNDGSMDEGVAYGSYTSRGLTQYVFLALRHLNTDHTKNPWLKEHFWFFYETTLPGYQRAVAIADSNHNWFYGPESQLVFLDSYVMRNGYGNWLAYKIRRAKPKNKPLTPSAAQRWCTIHTEFVFYNATLKPKKPGRLRKNGLHVFSDWGVVTYGGAQDMSMGNSFLSFKSGSINGEGVGEIITNGYYPELVKGWYNFNPGHEHPDQNSFVFAPNGRYFITEAMYGPKYSYLDNVISFSPSATSQCNQPWEGQIGECLKWLQYKDRPNNRGEIVSAAVSDEMVFIAGESVDAYEKSLGLAGVFRGALLLNTEVLVVVDSIRLLPFSSMKKASATFHNILHQFQEYDHLGHKGGQVTYPEGAYKMFSMVHGKELPTISLVNGVQPTGLREGPTNYINCTFNLNEDVTNIVHVFSGPSYKINSASFKPSTNQYGIKLSLNVNNLDYQISIATITRSSSKKISPIKERSKFTGFGGYARVDVGSQSHFFGSGKNDTNDGSDTSLHMYLPQIDSKNENLPFLHDDMLSLSPLASRLMSSRLQSKGIIQLQKSSNKAWNLTPLFIMITAAFLLLIYTRRNAWSRIKFWHMTKCILLGICVLFVFISIGTLCSDSNVKYSCWFWRGFESTEIQSMEGFDNFTTPFVFVTSLPGTGSELLENLFDNSTDFLYVPIQNKKNSIPRENFSTEKLDLCEWPDLNNELNMLTLGWFNSLLSQPFMHFNNMPNTETTTRIKNRIREHPNTALALSASSGFWNTKLPWLRHVVGEQTLHPFFFVRDPRSWINILLNHEVKNSRSKTLTSLLQAYYDLDKSCDDALGIISSVYLEPFRKFRENQNSEMSKVQKLAMLWTLSTATALYNEATPKIQRRMQIVRFEDVLQYPEVTATDIFARLGMPLNVKRLSKLMRTVKSGFFISQYDEKISSELINNWKTSLTENEVNQIEMISCPLMRVLNYECQKL